MDNFICNVFWSILVDEMLVGSNSENTQPDSRDTRLEPEPVSSSSGLEREEWAGGREVEALLQLAPEEAQSRLQAEAAELGRERAQQSREAAGISNLMYRDVQVCAGREGRGRLGGFGGCRIHSLSHTHINRSFSLCLVSRTLSVPVRLRHSVQHWMWVDSPR